MPWLISKSPLADSPVLPGAPLTYTRWALRSDRVWPDLTVTGPLKTTSVAFVNVALLKVMPPGQFTNTLAAAASAAEGVKLLQPLAMTR